MHTISPNTWADFVRLYRTPAVRAWAGEGIFAAAVGRSFVPGAADTFFYVGKAGGPLIGSVGIAEDQSCSAAASTKWMLERRNPSAFWQFADLLADRRDLLAWSNVAKIDNRLAGPPRNSEWQQIRDLCLCALKEEMETLRPARTVFATSNFCVADLLGLFRDLRFSEFVPDALLNQTRCFQNDRGQLLVLTKHPQGWQKEPRNQVASFVRNWRL